MQINFDEDNARHLGYIPYMPTSHHLAILEYEIAREKHNVEPNPETVIKYYHLKKLEFAWTLYRPKYRVTREREDDRGYLETTLSTYIWGQDNRSLLIEYPETWWDAFKNRWFPEWLLLRYPTNWIEYCIDSKTVYPLLEIDAPQLTHTVPYNIVSEKEQHWFKKEAGHSFVTHEYRPYPKTLWEKFKQFVKDCIPP